MIQAINSQYVPIYIASEDYKRDDGKASAEERAAWRKMLQEAWREKSEDVFLTSDATCFVLDPNSRECVAAIRLPKLMEVPRVLDMLNGNAEKLGVKPGPTAIPPSEQVRPDRAVKPDELGIHMVSRSIPSGGTWKALPAEDYVILVREEWEKFLPPENAKVGDMYTIAKNVNDKILINLYPPSPNRDPDTNHIASKPMKATVVSIKDGITRVRLDNEFRMKHHFLPAKDDDRYVEATLVGYVDVDTKSRQIQKLRMVTEKAKYDVDGFGSAIQSVAPGAAPNPAAAAVLDNPTKQDLEAWLGRGALIAGVVTLALGAAVVMYVRAKSSAARRAA